VQIKSNLQANGFSTPLLTEQKKKFCPIKLNYLLKTDSSINYNIKYIKVKLEFLQNNSWLPEVTLLFLIPSLMGSPFSLGCETRKGQRKPKTCQKNWQNKQLKVRKTNQIFEETRTIIKRNKCFSSLANSTFKKCEALYPGRR
jgi:hypothetical protein